MGFSISIDAERLVNEGHRYANSIKWVFNVFGAALPSWVDDAIQFCVAASDTQEERDQLIKWLRYLPGFHGKQEGEVPTLPEKYLHLVEAGERLKEAGCIEGCKTPDCDHEEAEEAPPKREDN